MIKVEILLMIGDKLLTSECHQVTRSVPFRNFVNFNFNTKVIFPLVKISSLPLEARLCFNVVCFSGQGQKLIIGSGYLNLFNSAGHLFQDGIDIYLWPFYKVGQRIVCQSDYNGFIQVKKKQQDENDSSDLDLDSDLDSENKDNLNEPYKNRCRLFLKFPKYSKKATYSLRDNETMVNLGHINFPKSFDDKTQPTEENLISVKTLLYVNQLELKLDKKTKR